MDDAIAAHFLLHQTEGEHLNTPVGVRRITHSLIHLFILFPILRWMKGKDEALRVSVRVEGSAVTQIRYFCKYTW